MEQHEKAHRLSQNVRNLRHLHFKGNQEFPAAVNSSPNSDTLMELDKDEEEAIDCAESETLSKKVFLYHIPGLEILRCKYCVAVTEVVELKAEMKALREKQAQPDEGTPEEKPGRGTELQKLERQVVSLEKTCHERQEKVTKL